MKKFMKYLMIIFSILAIISATFFIWYNLPINKIERAFKEENYEVVVENYPKLKKMEDIEYVEKELFSKAKYYLDQYAVSDREYNLGAEYYKLISKDIFKDNEDYLKIESDFNNIYESRQMFEKANSLKEKGDYIKAIEAYEAVIKEDKLNYSNAITNIDYCNEKYCEKLLMAAKGCMESQLYEDALAIIEEGLTRYPSNQELIKLQNEIYESMNETVLITGCWSADYDASSIISEYLGKKISSELIVKLVAEFNDSDSFDTSSSSDISNNQVKLYLDSDSVYNAIDILAVNEKDLINDFAKDYGIDASTGDLMISLFYGGSYSKFIKEEFGSKIDELINEYTFQLNYEATDEKIYLWETNSEKNEDFYVFYENQNGEIIINDYSEKLDLPVTINLPVRFERN